MYKVKYAVNLFDNEASTEYLYITVSETFFDGRSKYPLRPRFEKPVNSEEAFNAIIETLKKHHKLDYSTSLILFDIADKYIDIVEDNKKIKLMILNELSKQNNIRYANGENNINSLLELMSTHFDNLPFSEDDFAFYDSFIDLWYPDENYNVYCKREIRKFASISFTHEIVGVVEECDSPYPS